MSAAAKPDWDTQKHLVQPGEEPIKLLIDGQRALDDQLPAHGHVLSERKQKLAMLEQVLDDLGIEA